LSSRGQVGLTFKDYIIYTTAVLFGWESHFNAEPVGDAKPELRGSGLIDLLHSGMLAAGQQRPGQVSG